MVMLIGRRDLPTAGGLAIGSSTIAVIWHRIFNTLFERWKARQNVHGRSTGWRIVHAISFEGRIAPWLVPFMGWWLSADWEDRKSKADVAGQCSRLSVSRRPADMERRP